MAGDFAAGGKAVVTKIVPQGRLVVGAPGLRYRTGLLKANPLVSVTGLNRPRRAMHTAPADLVWFFDNSICS